MASATERLEDLVERLGGSADWTEEANDAEPDTGWVLETNGGRGNLLARSLADWMEGLAETVETADDISEGHFYSG